MEGPPHITPMTWASAREVLPHEAHDFTPWLAANLELLADVLGLDHLELVATEWKVETFALDILAEGSDADGDVQVVIENQYGQTDHRHLGQLLTYAAHAAAGGRRVLAVWLVEEARPAHLAAVEFINRIAAEGSTFGLVLLRVRFAPAPQGWHVHFEVDSAPNAFLSQAPPNSPTSPTKQDRARFIEAVTAELDAPLEAAGMRRGGGINTRHGAVTYRFPSKLEINKYAAARVVASADHTNVGLYLQRYPTPAENWAVAEHLRQTYEGLLDQYGLRVDTWHGSGANIKRDRIITRLPTGYADGDATAVAHEAARIISAWSRMLSDYPVVDVSAAVDDLVATTPEPAWDGDGDDEADI